MRGGIFEKTRKGFEGTRRVIRLWREKHQKWPPGAVTQVIREDGRADFLFSRDWDTDGELVDLMRETREERRAVKRAVDDWPRGAVGLFIHRDGRLEWIYRNAWDEARARHDRWSDGERKEIA